MTNKYYLFFILLSALKCNFFMLASEHVPLVVHIICQNNGKGLERDHQIIKRAIDEAGHHAVSQSSMNFNTNIDFADVNIFFERIDPHYLPFADQNWFVPNPEWFNECQQNLNQIDLILCRTKEVERIFNALNMKTFFIGFTSKDFYDEALVKDYSSFCHLAGGADQKGTVALIEIWKRNPTFPLLTVLKHEGHITKQTVSIDKVKNVFWFSCRLPDQCLHLLQNQCGIHFCTSETEGFGHYLLEGMSTGSVVITTDAPPMNEFIRDPRCLVPYYHQSNQNLGINYYVDRERLEETIKNILSLPTSELEAIGTENRRIYKEKSQQFKENLQNLLNLEMIRKSSGM